MAKLELFQIKFLFGTLLTDIPPGDFLTQLYELVGSIVQRGSVRSPHVFDGWVLSSLFHPVDHFVVLSLGQVPWLLAFLAALEVTLHLRVTPDVLKFPLLDHFTTIFVEVAVAIGGRFESEIVLCLLDFRVGTVYWFVVFGDGFESEILLDFFEVVLDFGFFVFQEVVLVA
jgi:hypothetical protein